VQLEPEYQRYLVISRTIHAATEGDGVIVSFTPKLRFTADNAPIFEGNISFLDEAAFLVDLKKTLELFAPVNINFSNINLETTMSQVFLGLEKGIETQTPNYKSLGFGSELGHLYMEQIRKYNALIVKKYYMFWL
jgi:hypothetical protein